MKNRKALSLVILVFIAGCAGGDAPLPDPAPPLQSGLTYNCGLLGGTYKFSKAPASQTVKAGAPFDWTVTLENDCTLPILNLAINDPVPDARVTGVDESGSVLLGCASTDHNVTCGSLSNVLGIGNDAAIAIHARAPLAAGTTTNTAAMSGLLNLGGILGILSVASVTETVTVIVEASTSDFTVDATFVETVGNTDAPVNFGDDGRFAITVDNPSTGQTLYAGLVRIAFQVSPLFNNVSIGTPPVGFSCTRSGRTVTCVNTADIPPDTTRTLTVDVEAGVTAGVASSTVTVLPTASGLIDPDLTDNTKTIDVTIESPVGADLRPAAVDMAPANDLTPPPDIAGFTSSDLVLTKFAGQSCATPLGTFGYVLSISNNGSNAAEKVQIVDDLPFNIGGCAENNPDWDCPSSMSGSIVCTKNTPLASGGTSVLALTCVAGLAGSIAANHAMVSHAGANFDPNLANNEATSSAIDIQLVCSGGDLKNADLELTGAQPACVLPSSSFDYDLTVKNNGADAANAARVTMTLPPGVLCSAPSGWDCSASTLSGPVNCISTQSIPNGGSRLLHLACVAPSALTTLVLTANANHADFTTDTTPGNNSLSLTRAMTAACGLSVSAHLEVANTPVDSVEIGQSFVYVITVSNTLATGDLTDVTIEDTYPTTGTLGTLPSGCTETSGKITCAIPTLGSTPIEIEIPFTAPAAPTVITSTITVASPSAMDPDTADNTIVIHSDVVDPNTGPRSDVAVIKDDSDDPVIAGTEWTYDFTVTTSGPNMARQFTITDTLPATTTFAGSTSEGWTCVGTTTVVCTYVGDPLIPGATSLLQLKMQVANPSAGAAPAGCPSGTRGKLINTATLAVTTPTDPVATNNTDDETTCVVTTDHANEAPIQLWGGSSTFPVALAGAEDTPITLTGANALTITDPDVVESTVEVTITITNGTITLSGTAGLTFSAGDGTADTTVTLRGTLAAINAALDGATITPNPNFAGAMSIAVTTNDLGKTGSGGPQSDSDTATVDVVNANDPPVINPDTINVLPDSTDNVLDVLANDSDPDGDTLTISDVGTPSSGTITVSSDGATLIYTPEPGFVGTVTVTYTVSDGTVGVESTLTFTVSESGDMAAIADMGTAGDMTSASVDMSAAPADMTPIAGADMNANNGTYYNIAGGGLGGCSAGGAPVGLESSLVAFFTLSCALFATRRRRGR